MSITFRPAKRENVPLLLGLAGGTGSGKTMSALLIARGMAAGNPFAVVDSENGRAKHYAETFPEMRHADIKAPFRPSVYAEAIEAADKEGFPVVVVDSASHEWAGDGGCLDWQEELMGGDESKRGTSWIKPKREHKRMLSRLLQVKAHVILCFRAEPKIEFVKENGRTKVVDKRGLTGLDGWFPITQSQLPFELTASFLLMADAPGVPRPIKLEEQHKPFVPLDRPLDEEVGKRLAAWARGSKSGPTAGGADRASSGTLPEAARPEEGLAAEPSSGSPFTPPTVLRMSAEEFKAAREREGISPQQVGAKGRELFPGRSSADLNDEERAQLWTALIQKQEALVS